MIKQNKLVKLKITYLLKVRLPLPKEKMDNWGDLSIENPFYETLTRNFDDYIEFISIHHRIYDHNDNRKAEIRTDDKEDYERRVNITLKMVVFYVLIM